MKYIDGEDIILTKPSDFNNLTIGKIYTIQKPLGHYTHSIDVVLVKNDNGDLTFIDRRSVRKVTVKDKLNILIDDFR